MNTFSVFLPVLVIIGDDVFIFFAGKTLLAKTLARFVNVPFVIADATTLTQVISRNFMF
jgi:ATP-dependent protease Clp ATPase subunit